MNVMKLCFSEYSHTLEDNLLTAGSELIHDGETPTGDESLSPTTERLAVYLWMTIIDKRLPAYISREYSHDLQTMTLKDIQPCIAENIQSILETINTSEDIQIQYARSGYSNRRHQSTRLKDSKPVSAPRKMCILCKASGCTSSLISKSFLKLAGITTKPTFHSARTVDKSSLNLQGEVSINIQFGNMNLPITALVVTSLDCDILGGVPFCRENDIGVHLKDEEFSLHGKRLSYGAKPKQVQNIFRVESVLLRNDTDKVVMPGEFIEFENDSLIGYEGELAFISRVSREGSRSQI